MRGALAGVALAVAMGCALASCSDESNGSADPESSTSAVSTKPADASTTSESAATTTSAPSTTAVVATTVAPATTVVAVAVAEDFLALYDAYWACLRTPNVCDPAAITASVGPARAALTKTVADLVSGGFFVGPEDPGHVVVESVDVAAPTSATVTYCAWDTGVLYGPPAIEGGDPVVVNDLQVTSRFQTVMVFEGGSWLTSEEVRIERVEGENRCPPES
jgi:hypothetical protein